MQDKVNICYRMDGFKNIEIKNFRGIDHLTIDDFSRVNVFLGQNSSGKSSVLECLLMMMGMSNQMRLYTLAKTLKNGHQAYKYTYEGLSGACENDVEIKGNV